MRLADFSEVASSETSGLPVAFRASGGRGSLQGGQTAKACSGGRVQSLRKGCDCQAEPILNKFPLPKMVRIALLRKPAGRAHSNPKNAPALTPGRLVPVDLYFCFFPSRPLIAFAGLAMIRNRILSLSRRISPLPYVPAGWLAAVHADGRGRSEHLIYYGVDSSRSTSM